MTTKPKPQTDDETTPKPSSAVTVRGAADELEEAWEVYEPGDIEGARAHVERTWPGMLETAPHPRSGALDEATRLYGRDFKAESAAFKNGTHPLSRVKPRAG